MPTSASSWAFARAVGLEGPDAEVAVRAAHAEVWPGGDVATLLVAEGRTCAALKDCAVPGPTPFARAYRSLEWPVQVVLWGGTVDALPLSTVYGALEGHRGAVWDPARQVLRAYVAALADVARPDCADALRRIAGGIDHASLRDPRDLDPHLATCRTCQHAFPLRVAEELRLLAAPEDPLPPGLARQLAADEARMAAGLPLTLPGAEPRRRPPVALLALAAGVAVVIGSAALASRSLSTGATSHAAAPRAAVSPSAGQQPAHAAPPNGLPTVTPAPADPAAPTASSTAPPTPTTAAGLPASAPVDFGLPAPAPHTLPHPAPPLSSAPAPSPARAVPSAPSAPSAPGAPAGPAAPAQGSGPTTTTVGPVAPDALPLPPPTTAPPPVFVPPPAVPPPTTTPATTAPPTTAP
ncbi:MAG TPA: hypothetical protein VMU14_21495, partial [Acidimicrobiales bacterium]|nr:hypothetical protein [Acidimicrobiales bacterium]